MTAIKALFDTPTPLPAALALIATHYGVDAAGAEDLLLRACEDEALDILGGMVMRMDQTA